jgi:hypothetical protein
MLRVNNVEIPNSKRIEISLQYIYGIGSTTAQGILRDTVRRRALRPARLQRSAQASTVCGGNGSLQPWTRRAVLAATSLQSSRAP